MDRYHRLMGQRLTALFLAGCLLFNYPLLQVFSVDGFLWGIPILYIYIFTAWLAVIGLVAVIIEVRK